MTFPIINDGFSRETLTQSCDGCAFFYPLLEKCDVNRLEKLKQYEMNRFCNLYRNESWQEYHWNGGQTLEHRALDESVLPFDAIVYDQDGASIDTYIAMADELDYEVKPRQVIFVVNSNEVNIPELGDALQKMSLGYPWKIKHVLGEETSFEEAVDMTSKDCGSTFMAVLSVYYELQPNTFLNIDNLYNNEFKPIFLITESSGNFFMVDKLLFDSLGRNGGTYPEDGEFSYLKGNAINKITQQAHKENRADRLWDLGDILS